MATESRLWSRPAEQGCRLVYLEGAKPLTSSSPELQSMIDRSGARDAKRLTDLSIDAERFGLELGCST